MQQLQYPFMQIIYLSYSSIIYGVVCNVAELGSSFPVQRDSGLTYSWLYLKCMKK